MPQFFTKIKEVATPPGTFITGDPEEPLMAKIKVMDYDAQNLQEREITNIQDCFPFRDTPTITWINIDGKNPDVIKAIDEHFGIHPLVLEDIVDAGQRAKFEDYGDYAFLVIKMIYIDKKTEEIHAEQISLIIGNNYVISFQEREGDVFDPIRERIRAGKGRIRKMGADYLAYVLLDAIVDNYFLLLEKKGDEIEEIEEFLLTDDDPTLSWEIHQQKRNIAFLRKQIWPLREVLSTMQRWESKLIKKQTNIFLRDVYDHTTQVIDTIESFRDLLSGLHDLYLFNINNKMNEIIKVLTMFTAIFIPLTFVTGIYGMNFEFMPELRWRYGYFILLFAMAIIAGSMIFYFKRKKWF